VSGSVDKGQRHTRSNRCEVCDGADQDPRGEGKRCGGYISEDGQWIHCSREEFAGGIPPNHLGNFAHKRYGRCNCGSEHNAESDNPDPHTGDNISPFGEPDEIYRYTDEKGALLYEITRYGSGKTKRFMQRVPDASLRSGWRYKTKGVRRVLYNLQALSEDDADRDIYVVEGEKDANTLIALGYLATTNPMGAGKWNSKYDGIKFDEHAREVLAKRRITIIADADAEGRAHAATVRECLLPVAASVRIVEPPAPHKDVTELLQAGGSMDQLAAPEPPDDFGFLDLEQIFAPLPDLHFVLRELGIVLGGAPVMFAGYGYSGKTVAAQEALLSIVLNRPVWGAYRPAIADGRCIHFDFEQGNRLTRERYQRLANGFGTSLEEIVRTDRKRLRLAVLPKVRVDSPGAEDKFARAFEGVSVVLIDSLRASAPSADENSSEVRRYLDVLAGVAEKTGTSVWWIHHARKPSENDVGGRKFSIRGSSALFDAVASAFIFEAERGEPTIVTHEKCRNTGTEAAPFILTIEDVPAPIHVPRPPPSGDPAVDAARAAALLRWGLRIRHSDAETAAEELRTSAEAEQALALAKRVSEVRNAVSAHPGCSTAELRTHLQSAGCAWAAQSVTLTRAIEDAKLVNGSESQRSYAWYPEGYVPPKREPLREAADQIEAYLKDNGKPLSANTISDALAALGKGLRRGVISGAITILIDEGRIHNHGTERAPLWSTKDVG